MNLSQSSDLRLLVFFSLGFVMSALLGSAIEPALAPFLWLIVARPLVGLVLSVLPRTRMGGYRPWMLAGTLVTGGLATMGLGARQTAGYLAVLFLYLIVDTSLDALVIESSPEKDWVGNVAVLVVARTLGVMFGLVTSSMIWPPTQEEPSKLFLVLIGLLCLVTAGLRERPHDTLVPRPGLDPDRCSVTDWLKPALANLTSGAVLAATFQLCTVTALLGVAGGDTLPYAVLSVPRILDWTAAPVRWLGVLGTGCAVATLFGTISVRRLLLGTLSVFIAAVVASSLPNPSPLAQLAMQAAGIAAALAALRSALREAARVPPPLRAALFSALWVASSLSLGWFQSKASDNGVLALKGALLGLVAIFLIHHLRSKEPQVELLSPFSAERDRRLYGQTGRHGDKSLDFEAGPAVTPKKRRRRGSLSYFSLYGLLVRFPISLISLVLLSLGVAGLWQLSESREAWRARARSAWFTLKTEVFLTSLAHRIQEEMVAANRVPTDWQKFVETNFDELDGRPRQDVDEWGNSLSFHVGPDDVTVTSAGPDQAFGTDDDIIRTVPRPAGVK